jgi:mono/diheme cytochrome c family protein
MIERALHRLWIDIKTDAQHFWSHLKYVVTHPWESLLTMFAGIGWLILAIPRVIGRLLLWLWKEIKYLLNVSVKRLGKILLFAAVALSGLIFLGIAFLVIFPGTQRPNFQGVDQHIYLSEGRGWSGGYDEPLRQLFYYTPQGTTVKGLPYSWFVALEVPLGSTSFTTPERMNAFGFLVDGNPTQANPDHLPVGFTSHYDSGTGAAVLDITCAACHTGELVVNKNGKRYGMRIDGGAAMHAFTTAKPGNFTLELLASLTSTYLDPFKFNRFARRVLGPDYPNGYWRLHGDLRSQIWIFLKQAANDNQPLHPLYPTVEGVGRTDALARIGNTVFGDELSSSNYRVGNAPVRYPPVWDIWKFDYVQYDASVRQPMSRNLGESLGVGAKAALLNRYGAPIPAKARYDTTSDLENLHKIEVALWSLEPPKWSEDCLGEVKWEDAKEGQRLFAMTCALCHGPFPASDSIKEWKAPLKTAAHAKDMESAWDAFLATAYKGSGKQGQPAYTETKWTYPQDDPFPLWVMHTLTVQDVGTDPRAAVNFVDKEIDLRPLGLDSVAVTKVLRSVFQTDLRMQIKAFADDIVARTTGNSALQDVRNAAADISKQINTTDASQASQPLSPDQAANLKPLSSKIRQRVQGDSSLASNHELQNDAASLDQQITSGQATVDAKVESINMAKANTGIGLSLVGYFMRNKYYATMEFSPAQIGEMDGFGQIDLPVALPQYKPRPLAGIWAVGPFLHNGSVPTIYQLLGPADARDKKFWVGTRDFDPVNLGLSTRPLNKGGFQLDTSVTGNSNIGHEFRRGYIPWKPGTPPQYGVIGPEFTEKQRRQIIEYLKVHRDTHSVKLLPDRTNIMEYLQEGLDTRHVCQ